METIPVLNIANHSIQTYMLVSMSCYSATEFVTVIIVLGVLEVAICRAGKDLQQTHFKMIGVNLVTDFGCYFVSSYSGSFSLFGLKAVLQADYLISE